ncbi:hypothetical protein AB9P05_13885 [Roseivirga sp. BDSF3-8]|uniref:hypothetical protein n=1 Tax=Roseivirga sp. BDSF3-8 TaxID=3241598 RepID=UPI0035322508
MQRKKLSLSELNVQSFKTSSLKASRGGNPSTLTEWTMDESCGECPTINYTFCDGGYVCINTVP